MNIEAANATSAPLQSFGQQNLDKMDFLRLLVSQVQQQDPLNPMSNDEFVAQLTQFSILEQNQNVNSSLQGLREMANIQQAASLVGREISFQQADGRLANGRVQAVHFDTDGTLLEVDGQYIDPAQVASVRVATTPPPLTTDPE